jgi:hypothetical protein
VEDMEVNNALSYRNSFHFICREYYSQQGYSKQGQAKSCSTCAGGKSKFLISKG